MEHVADPHAKVKEFYRILNAGGLLLIVVPCELPTRRQFKRWTPALDVHLYSWNSRSLGNLVSDCGFDVKLSRILSGGYSHYNKWLLAIRPLFWVAERLTAHILGRFQLLCVATKPMSAGVATLDPLS